MGQVALIMASSSVVAASWNRLGLPRSRSAAPAGPAASDNYGVYVTGASSKVTSATGECQYYWHRRSGVER